MISVCWVSLLLGVGGFGGLVLCCGVCVVVRRLGLWVWWGCGAAFLCVVGVCVTGFGVEVSLGSSRPLSVRFDCGFERPRLILPRVAVCLDAGADALLTGERRGQGDASFGGLVFEC